MKAETCIAAGSAFIIGGCWGLWDVARSNEAAAQHNLDGSIAYTLPFAIGKPDWWMAADFFILLIIVGAWLLFSRGSKP